MKSELNLVWESTDNIQTKQDQGLGNILFIINKHTLVGINIEMIFE
jgi:hypothetical protein